MPLYSSELIEEIRSSVDIVDVISSYVKLKKTGSNYMGLCPFHNEKSGSFSVSRERQMYHCFGCGVSGNVYTFLMEYENASFVEAVQELAQMSGIALPEKELSYEEKRQMDRKEKLMEIQKEAAKYFYALMRNPRGEAAYKYFKGRQLTDETMKKFGLGYSDKYYDDLYKYLHEKGYSDELLKDSGLVGFDEKHGMHDKFWNRAMFPIMNVRGKVIAFGGRVMGDGEPKYLNSQETPIFEKSRNLYALNYARSTKRRYMILCEGYMDVIALHQAGFDNAVAALGTAFTSGHAGLLRRYTKEVYLSFDSDGAGIKAAMRAIPILKEASIPCKIIHMDPYKDPDEFIKALGAEEYQKRIDQAEPSFLFEVGVIQRDYDMNDPSSKTEFQKKIAEKILDFPLEIERENYIVAVSQKYFINADLLRKLVNQLAAAGVAIVHERPKPTPSKRSGLDKASHKSQGLLLTWLSKRPELYADVKGKISPADFTDDEYRQVAQMLFDQLDQGTPNPVGIISQFTDPQMQTRVANSFHVELPEFSNKDDERQALQDILANIRNTSLQEMRKSNDTSSLADLQDFINKQAQMKGSST